MIQTIVVLLFQNTNENFLFLGVKFRVSYNKVYMKGQYYYQRF